jgi:N-acetylglucosaminyldiphosphoundecaprenol N-acetyl-beta-D-mannosaminyltransferase
MQKEIEIMDVRFNNVTMDEVLDFIFTSNKKGYICTPNPEMLLEAQNNHKFLKVLNHSLLNIPDGIGILWAATQIHKNSSKLNAILNLPLIALFPGKFKKVLRERVTGTDLLQKICEIASKNGIKLFFLGATTGIAENAAQKLEHFYPDLKIVGTHAGSPALFEQKEIINLINETDAEILFVAYGAPKQEIWISETLHKLNKIKIAIGIGGAFDFFAGKRKRAPKIMQKLGLEWLFRLIQEPTRIKRIYNATIKFPIEIIKRLK